MKRNHRHFSKPARFFVTVISLVAGFGSYGALVTPAMAATTPVSVDQQPLNIPPPIPPNIVLMLDDSGSMRWDVMPDYGYLGDTSPEGLVDSDINDVYYNPTGTYTLPPAADGTLYPPSDFANAPINGFDASSAPVDLSTYRGRYDSSDTSYNGSPVQYSISVAKAGATSYPAAASCPSGTQLSAGAQPGYCAFVNHSQPDSWYNFYDIDNNYYYISRCNSVQDVYDYSSDTCMPGISFFTYTTTNSGGGYTRHYVAKETGDCAAAGLSSDVCDESTVTQQNVANWFSYYHTRILMAKSGLMTAFADLSSTYRLGFGSINGGNDSQLSSPSGSFGGNELAEVQPFGDGASGTQKAKFWNWVSTLVPPKQSTPLRKALAAVGSYYQSTQPWTNMASDPQFGDTNPYNASSPGSPLQCRQAYTILTTDGFWNGSYSSTTTAGASNKAGPTFTPPSSQNPPYTGYTPADPFQGGATDDGSPSLADVAMYYWDHDLQDGTNGSYNLANEVVPNPQDPAYWQHMVTFTMGLGFTPKNIAGTAPNGHSPPTTQDILDWANDGGGSASKFAISGFSWPTPSANNGGSENNIADLEHAGVDGHGGFFSATGQKSFVNGLEAALGGVGQRSGTGASLGANSTKLQTGTVVYQAKYSTSPTNRWTGDLLALALNQADGALAATCPSTGSPQPCWSAAKVLHAMGTSSSGSSVVTYPNRDIQTYNPQGTSYDTQFIAFKNATTTITNPDGTTSTAATPPALSSTQLGNLGSDAVAQTNMVNYLRGDSTLERQNGGAFRNRISSEGVSTPLGDIVDSQPVYDGAPDATEFNGQSFYGLAYQTDSSGNSVSPFYDFVSNEVNRAGMIYVAANDGMLHAFNASTGDITFANGAKVSPGGEMFAYLPGALLVNQADPATGIQEPLSNLSNPDYGSTAVPHQYYNDGQVTVADAYVALAQEGEISPSWHTILVGTTGRGPARAVYAIDVTDPTTIKPLWERYAGDTVDSNSGYIGEVTGKPIIAQTNATSATSTWSVVMGNGYNSPNGVPAMLQFNLATGALSAYTTSDTVSGNGLAGVFTWMDNPSDGVTDLAYAGDLRGNVYQFTLNDNTGANPSNASSATSKYTTRLFTATDASGARQPITTQMTAAENPTDGNLWLFFGTGKYLTSDDVSDTSVQTWYGIIVTPGSTQVSTLASNLSNERGVLVQRSILAELAGSGSTLPARVVTPMPSTPDITCSSKSKCMAGWYMDLVSPTANGGTLAQGERMVYPNSLQGGLLIGTTIIPQPANQTNDPCSPQGSGWIMAVDPFTGTNPPQNFFDINGNGAIDGGDYVTYGGKQVAAAGVGFGDLPNAPIFVGGVAEVPLGSGTVVHIAIQNGSGSYQRVLWRELVN